MTAEPPSAKEAAKELVVPPELHAEHTEVEQHVVHPWVHPYRQGRKDLQ